VKSRRDDFAPGDDGKPVADMNVEGMPWYDPRHRDADITEGTPLSKAELRAYRWAAVKAGLLVALVFGTAFLLFLLFADFVWLR